MKNYRVDYTRIDANGKTGANHFNVAANDRKDAAGKAKDRIKSMAEGALARGIERTYTVTSLKHEPRYFRLTYIDKDGRERKEVGAATSVQMCKRACTSMGWKYICAEEVAGDEV